MLTARAGSDAWGPAAAGDRRAPSAHLRARSGALWVIWQCIVKRIATVNQQVPKFTGASCVRRTRSMRTRM